jgi:hypothetical protein
MCTFRQGLHTPPWPKRTPIFGPKKKWSFLGGPKNVDFDPFFDPPRGKKVCIFATGVFQGGQKSPKMSKNDPPPGGSKITVFLVPRAKKNKKIKKK